MVNCGIYKIQNNTNHMIYIGQSINIEERFKQHKRNKNNYKIHQAIQSQGVDNFTFSIIQLCDKQDLNKQEQKWIKFYDCQWPKGYNQTPGGTGWNPAIEATKIEIGQYSLSGQFIKSYQSQAEAIRQNNIGHHISEVLNCSDRQCGGFLWIAKKENQNFPLYTEPYNKNNRCHKIAVYQIDPNTNKILKEYPSVKDAAKAVGLSCGAHISSVIKGKRRTAGGYKWTIKE